MVKLHRRHLWIAAMIMALLAIWVPILLDTSVKFENGLPVRPSSAPAYVNTTDLKELDRIAKFELERGEKYTNIEFAMVILDDLPPNISLEQYAVNLFRFWDVGRNHNGRGILYVLVKNQGLLKIETSYELESIFPDAFIQSYQQTIKEFFKNEQLGDVISHLVVEMVNRVKNPQYEMSVYKPEEDLGENLSGGAGIAGDGYVVNRIKKNLDDTKDDRYDLAKYEIATSPQKAAEKFLSSLEEGISSPQLGILTEGSRYMAMEYHRSASYQRNRYKDYERSMPYKIYQNGPFAVARFAKSYARPIFMRQTEDGRWLVDESKMWAYVDGWFQDDGLHYFVQRHYNPSVYSFALNFKGDTLMEGLLTDRPDQLPVALNLKDYIHSLEAEIAKNPNSAQAYFNLADVLFYENYWIKDAIDNVEKGLTLDPYNERYLRRAIFFGSKMPDYTHMAEHFEALLKIHSTGTEEDQRYYNNINYHYKCFKKIGAFCSTTKVLK